MVQTQTIVQGQAARNLPRVLRVESDFVVPQCVQRVRAGLRKVCRVAKDEVRQRISGGAPSPVVIIIAPLRERVRRTAPRPFGLLVAPMCPEESELHGVRALHPGKVVRDRRNALQCSERSVLEGGRKRWRPQAREPSATTRLISPAHHIRNHRSNAGIAERRRYAVTDLRGAHVRYRSDVLG